MNSLELIIQKLESHWENTITLKRNDFLVSKNSQSYISGYENPNIEVIRRQNIKTVYFLEGSIYISKTDILLNKKTFYHDKTLGYELEKYKSFEIDDIYDFVMIEALMKYKSKKYDIQK